MILWVWALILGFAALMVGVGAAVNRCWILWVLPVLGVLYDLGLHANKPIQLSEFGRFLLVSVGLAEIGLWAGMGLRQRLRTHSQRTA